MFYMECLYETYSPDVTTECQNDGLWYIFDDSSDKATEHNR